MNSETSYFKTIISELAFLILFNETSGKKDLQLLATKLTEKYLILVM